MDQSLEVELGGRLEVSDKKVECRFFDELDFKSEEALPLLGGGRGKYIRVLIASPSGHNTNRW